MCRIYKYLHEDRIDVIKNQLIRFTQPSNFNDPFESLPSIESILSKEDQDKYSNLFTEFAFNDPDVKNNYAKKIDEIINEYNLPEETVEQIKKFSFEDAMTLGLQFLLPNLKSVINLEDESTKNLIQNSFRGGFDKSIGILSLTEKPDNMLMWSHYSNSHKGFVIQFDKTNSFFDQRKNNIDKGRILQKVKYVPERPNVVLLDFKLSEDKLLDQIIDKFILTKSDKWEYEEEWRMTHSLKKSDKKLVIKNEEIHLFKFPATIITGIVFGSNMSQEKKNEIISIVEGQSEYTDVQFMQAELDQMKYKINIVPF